MNEIAELMESLKYGEANSMYERIVRNERRNRKRK